MKHAFFAGAIALSAIALSGCQTTLQKDIDAFNTIVQQDLPTGCALLASADASFQTVAATGTLTASEIATEKQAYAGVKAICANPSGVNAATALSTLANAYAAIIQAKTPAVSKATALAAFRQEMSMRKISVTIK